MGLPLLYSRPTDEDSRNLWSFNHQAIHFAIHDAVFRQKNEKIASYQLSPINPESIGMWLYEHQTMHNQVNQVLFKRGGFDLLGLDWSDPSSFEQWLQLHGDEHQSWNAVLGV